MLRKAFLWSVVDEKSTRIGKNRSVKLVAGNIIRKAPVDSEDFEQVQGQEQNIAAKEQLVPKGRL